MTWIKCSNKIEELEERIDKLEKHLQTLDETIFKMFDAKIKAYLEANASNWRRTSDKRSF